MGRKRKDAAEEPTTEQNDAQDESVAVTTIEPLEEAADSDDEAEPADPEADEEFDRIMDEAAQALSDIFRKHGRKLSRASKSERKRLYDSEKVVGKTFDSEAKTIGDKIADEYRLLTQAMNANPKRNLSGIIVGCEKMPALKTDVAIVKANGTEGHYRIIIPVSRLFCYDPKQMNPNIDELTRSVRNRIGSEIKFQVVQVDEPSKIAFASRLDAMQAESRQNYVKKQPDGKPRLVKDNIVEATITSTRRNGVYLEVCGAECYVKGEDLGWTRVTEANEIMHVNEKVNVKLKDVQPYDYTTPDGTVYKLVKIEASIRDATPDPRAIFYDQFSIGQSYLAKVTEVNENHVFVSLGPNKMDAICFIPQFGTPARGDDVVAQVIDKNDAEKRISAIIVRFM